MADIVDPKKPWLSKTILLSVVTSLGGILGLLGVSGVNEFITGHADLILAVLGGLGVVLRLVTKGAIEIK